MFNINRRTVLLGMIILGLVVVGVLIFGKLDSSKFVSFYKLNFGYSMIIKQIARTWVTVPNKLSMPRVNEPSLFGLSSDAIGPTPKPKGPIINKSAMKKYSR